jgi:hypothetical protein
MGSSGCVRKTLTEAQVVCDFSLPLIFNILPFSVSSVAVILRLLHYYYTTLHYTTHLLAETGPISGMVYKLQDK